MTKFNVGDKVVMNQCAPFTGPLVYHKGDVGIISHQDVYGDWWVDFNGQGNDVVYQDGIWCATEERFDLVEKVKPKPSFTFGQFIRRIRTINPLAADWLRDEFRKKDVFNKVRGYAATTKEARMLCEEWASRSKTLWSLFTWTSSPQGPKFWMDINEKYRAKYK